MTLRALARTAMIGLVVAATTLPAAAASSHFYFGFGSDGFGFRRPLICVELTDYQIRKAVKQQGYSNVYLNVRNDRRIQVRATKKGWVYLLRVSTCTGTILERDKLRPA